MLLLPLLAMASAVVPVRAASATGSTAGASPNQNEATQRYLEMLDRSLAQNYLWALLGVVALGFLSKTIIQFHAHVRHLASMNSEGALRYFSRTSPSVSLVKSNLLYAPILSYRRAREIKFSRRVTFGTVPSRFQALFILIIVVFNIFASTWNVPWSDPQLQVLPILRSRTGTLSVVNLIPITVMATIKNPLIRLLDISYDSFSLLHRWFGRLAILQAIAHTVCHVIDKAQSKAGWAGVRASFQSPFIYHGMVATVAATIMLLQSPKILRNLSYEFFHHLHFTMVVIVMVFLWIHLRLGDLPQTSLLLGAIVIWATARSFRLATLVFRSVGKGGSRVTIQPMPGGAVKIHLTTPRPWVHRPGQSIYLTIPSIGLWTAHPFSVAWSGAAESLSRPESVKSDFTEKGPIVRSRMVDMESPGEYTISLVVQSHRGLTRKLWERAVQADTPLSLSAYVEGPYGTERSLSSYGTVMLFASGVGITHQLPYVRHLVEGYGEGTVAAKRVTLVWVIPSTECLDWIRPWMHEILGMDGRREVLRILIYITRAGLSQSITSPSEMVRMSRGRPDVQRLMWHEVEQKTGCLGVSVCAGGGMADEVRRVSRLMLDRGANLDFMEEGFGW